MFEKITFLVKESWKTIAPFWPLKNLVAVNPLKGLEDLPIEEALIKGAVFFQQTEMPAPIELINLQTIKWLQVFFDEGQATISMPFRSQGLYIAWKKLAYFDFQIHEGNQKKKQWILNLPENPQEAIYQCLLELDIPEEIHGLFLTLMLTTLHGWASYIKYCTHWAQEESNHFHKNLETEYIAMRLGMTCVLWENALDLIKWHKTAQDKESQKKNPIEILEKSENDYLVPLLKKISLQQGGGGKNKELIPMAQLVFCVDVRSEPFRRALESTRTYETFGYSGFFGIPIRAHNTITKKSYASCPALMRPKHTVNEYPDAFLEIHDKKKYRNFITLRALYQSIKCNFITSFSVVELLGIFSAFWMLVRTVSPVFAVRFFNYLIEKIRPCSVLFPSLDTISFEDQCYYAESIIKTINLSKNFSSLVVLCAHGSTTENNSYGTALHCGACSGHSGIGNAKVLAKILNEERVRNHLSKSKIFIPETTYFLAAEHNTTTDEVKLYPEGSYSAAIEEKINQLKKDLKEARKINSQRRSREMLVNKSQDKSLEYTTRKSADWAQVRPEWGLAKNASFFIAPWHITKKLDFEGRAFLHSYDYRQDLGGTILEQILTAPMIVAQWINAQYLFSTLDNGAYGSGSKITQNITGKVALMQGNASDLMNGLPFQSVYKNDTTSYHVPMRLITIVWAPWGGVDQVISRHLLIQKIFRNGWGVLVCIDPDNPNFSYILNRDLTWKKTIFN